MNLPVSLEVMLLIAVLILLVVSIVITIMKKMPKSVSLDAHDIDAMKTALSGEISKQMSDVAKSNSDTLEKVMKENADAQEKLSAKLHDYTMEASRTGDQSMAEMKDTMNRGFAGMQKMTVKMIQGNAASWEKLSGAMNDGLSDIRKTNAESLDAMRSNSEENLSEIRKMNEEKLLEMQQKINEKLDTALNKKLDENFQIVSSQLGSLYKSISELNTLSSDVSGLRKVLTGVRETGNWGKLSAETILTDILDPSQYVKDASFGPMKTAFAVKIPRNLEDGYVLLPIDCDFSGESYLFAIEASKHGDQNALKDAKEKMHDAIIAEAGKFSQCMKASGNSTAFGIIYLASESMYAEVLSIPGLAEMCQNKFKVVLTGPSTFTAMLNAIHAGFRTFEISRKSADAMKTLEAVSAQYEDLNASVAMVQQKLDDAVNAVNEMSRRTERIHARMQDIQPLEKDQAEMLLGL
jgi:DNA recombination protein RmuC